MGISILRASISEDFSFKCLLTREEISICKNTNFISILSLIAKLGSINRQGDISSTTPRTTPTTETSLQPETSSNCLWNPWLLWLNIVSIMDRIDSVVDNSFSHWPEASSHCLWKPRSL